MDCGACRRVSGGSDRLGVGLSAGSVFSSRWLGLWSGFLGSRWGIGDERLGFRVGGFFGGGAKDGRGFWERRRLEYRF